MDQLLLFVFLLGLIISSQLILSSCGANTTTDTLSQGRALAGDDRLVSANGKFALGFFQSSGRKNSPNNTYLGIWFNQVPELTPVWTANRDTPIVSSSNQSSSSPPPELMVSTDGNLVISAHRNSTVIWSTKANITTTDGDDNTVVAVLLNSGNFVLRNASNSSQTFWESFDHPTDVALSGAKLGWNRITGLNRRLVSRKNSVDQTTGLYSSEMEPDGTGTQTWNSSVVYWSSGAWNGRFFASEPEMAAGASMVNYTYYFERDREAYFVYTILDDRIVMYNVLGVSGQRMMRVWTGTTWLSLNTLPKSKCQIYATCGPFTVCADSGDTLCECMKGFSVRWPEDWELEDTSGGCIRNTPLNCGAAAAGGDHGSSSRNSTRDGDHGSSSRNSTGDGDHGSSSRNSTRDDAPDKFYPMPGFRLPSNGIGINASSNAECERICLNTCSCTAYSYGTTPVALGGCSIWHGELLNVAAATADYGGQTLHLRLAAAEVQTTKPKRSVGKKGVVIGVVVAASVVVALGFIILVLTVFLSRRKKKLSSSLKVDDSHQGNVGGVVGIVSYKYADLQRATKNFSDKLGAGSFGAVFKGCLPDSTIAVKRLDGTRQGDKEFRAEVSSIGIIQHINLVKLVGFCCDGERRLLVYEYMPNHSLETHLFRSNNSSTCLGWETRCQIALGVAKGLAYLHHGCRDCIIHCDIKPQNILLDASFAPKIADFGLAKFLGRDFSRVITTMRGTIGYLAPEWISGTAITSKVDVYSYGMVLLEIVSGRRNWNVSVSSEEDDRYRGGSFPTTQASCTDDDICGGRHAGYFPVQVVHELLQGDVGCLVDPRLNDNEDLNLRDFERLCRVAVWCIQDNEFQRPTMNEVVQFLEGTFEPDLPPMPKLLRAIAGTTGT